MCSGGKQTCVLAGGACSTLCKSRFTDCRSCVEGKRKGKTPLHQCQTEIKRRDGGEVSRHRNAFRPISERVAVGIRNTEWVGRESDWWVALFSSSHVISTDRGVA